MDKAVCQRWRKNSRLNPADDQEIMVPYNHAVYNELTEQCATECPNRPMPNTGNYCFGNAVLYALLATKDPFVVNTYLLPSVPVIAPDDKCDPAYMQLDLRYVADIIQMGPPVNFEKASASTLLKKNHKIAGALVKDASVLLHRWYDCTQQDKNDKRGAKEQNEPHQFISDLLYALQPPGYEYKIETQVIYNQEVYKDFVTVEVRAPIIDVWAAALAREHVFETAAIFPWLMDSRDETTTHEITGVPVNFSKRIRPSATPFLVISFNRSLDNTTTSQQELLASPVIQVGGKSLNLSAVVTGAHVSRSAHIGHFVCYYRCNGTWFWYNPSGSGSIQKSSLRAAMVASLRRGMIYIYTEA